MQALLSGLTRYFLAVLVLFFSVAAFWSIRLAIADGFYRENTIASVKRAVDLVPEDARYHALLAEHLERTGSDSDSEFRTAADLSPLESKYWIRLGFRAETEAKYSKAEEYLLHAAQVDRKFAPRWALMNFYFRRGNEAEFWTWTSRAFGMSYGDLMPMFRLMWALSDDQSKIRERVPHRPQTMLSYLQFLVTSGRMEASSSVARTSTEFVSTLAGSEALLDWWERAHLSDPDAALFVWNALCRRKILPYRQLDPKGGEVVTDGDLATSPTGRGFDWRIGTDDGVSTTVDESTREMLISFSGKQSENLVIAEQWLPVEPASSYSVTWESISRDGASISGLHWEVVSRKPEGDVALARLDFAAGQNRNSGRILFLTSQNETVLLRLGYSRPRGFTLAKGTFGIRGITGSRAK